MSRPSQTSATADDSVTPRPYSSAVSGSRAELIRLGALLVIAIAIGVGFYLFQDRLSGAIQDLKVGDCIDQPVGAQTIFEVQRQPCNEPHDGEVFAVVTHTAAPGASYPPQMEFDDLAGDECVPQLEAYTGLDVIGFITRGYDFAYVVPTDESWREGARTVICMLNRTDGSKLTASLRDSGASATPQ